MNLYFIRHGQAESNIASPEEGIVGSDLNLTPEGMHQAVAAADHLGKLATKGIVSLPDKIYSSPYKRAQQTARIIAEVLDLPVVTEDALKEIQKGDWHGMRVDDVIDLEGQVEESDRINFRPPSGKINPGIPGENPFDVAHRMVKFINDAEARGEDSVVAVSHNHPIESCIGELLGLPPSKWKDRPVDHAAINRLCKKDGLWDIDETLYNLKAYE